MKPIRLLNASRTLATGQDEYNDLDIMDADVGGQNCMFSVWGLTEEELKALNEGGKIQLGIMGGVHPPVMLLVQNENAGIVGVEEPEETEEDGGVII